MHARADNGSHTVRQESPYIYVYHFREQLSERVWVGRKVTLDTGKSTVRGKGSAVPGPGKEGGQNWVLIALYALGRGGL